MAFVDQLQYYFIVEGVVSPHHVHLEYPSKPLYDVNGLTTRGSQALICVLTRNDQGQC